MKHSCPECGAEMVCAAVCGADMSPSGKTERLYVCSECYTYLEVVEYEEEFDV